MKAILLFLSIVFCVNITIAQTPWYLPGNALTGSGNFVGSTTAFPLELKTTSTSGGGQPINFWTYNTLQMSLTSAGNLNIENDDKGFWIDGSAVLWHNGDISNMYVGVDAGYNDGGYNNVFVGGSAGYSNSSGCNNTFVGHNAGASNYGGTDPEGYGNTCIGQRACYSNSTGTGNTNVGEYSGQDNVDGDYNTCLGFLAGGGGLPGSNQTGNYNIFIGYSATPKTYNLENAIAIGSNTQVPNSNQMILGDNDIHVGIGLSGASSGAGPQTKLEINADPNSTTYTGTGGSGLRFRQLTSSSTTGTANGKVLTVDADGDVILVPATGSGGIAACSTATQNYLTKWCSTGNEIQNSIVYDNGTNAGIGLYPFAPAKLFVWNNTEQNGEVVATVTSHSFPNTGLNGVAYNSTNSNRGVRGQGGLLSFGFPTVVGGNNVGVTGHADGSTFNIGGVFEAGAGCSSNFNIGIYASATGYELSPTLCSPGIAGYFNGSVYRTGTDNFTSDIKLKDSIVGLKNALSVIQRLKINSYLFRNDSFPSMQLPVGRHYGVVAQQLDTVLPELVTDVIHPAQYDTSGTMLYDTIHYKAVNYIELIPLAIRGIQQLDTLVKGRVAACAAVTDSNYLTKWDVNNKMLCNSQIYDDGERIGIPVIDGDAYVNVLNHDQPVTGNFVSDFNNTSEVVKATYNTNGNSGRVTAVYGSSKYVNGSSEDDGVGGHFEGGAGGVMGLGDGAVEEGVGVFGQSRNATDRNIGVYGLSENATTPSAMNVGMFGQADSSDDVNVGMIGKAQYENSISMNAGVFGSAESSDFENFAGYFGADGSTGLNYGVLATATGGSGSSYYAGYFGGDVHATGTVTWVSDARFKTNVQNISSGSALAKLGQLQPKTYAFKSADYPYLALPQGNQYGLIAQEVEQVFPELVRDIVHPETKDMLTGKQTSPRLEYKGLNYAGLIPVLVSAVKEQQTEIDSLKEVINTRLTQLEERLNGCCGTGMAGKREETPKSPEGDLTAVRQTVELSNMQAIVLEQNVPNPFAEQTSISYFVPGNYQTAQLVFTDMLGNTIKTTDVKTGYGVMTVFASNLSSGQYSYSLVIDGKVAETKRMVKGR